MPTIEESIDIAASPLDVHEVLMDIDAAPLWTAGLERLELVAGVAGEPGCVGRALYVEGSRRYEVEDRLIEAVAGHDYLSEVEGGGIKATVATTLIEIRSGTRVTIRWAGTGTKPLTRLVLPFLRRQISRRTQHDLEALRDLVADRSD